MKQSVWFPHTVVDGFFDDPDSVRRFALNQEYNYDPEGEWPGKRTPPVSLLHPNFFHSTNAKIMSLFYHEGGDYTYSATGNFQIVDKNFGSGWVHSDKPWTLTAIVYLSPEGNQGTSLYTKKDPMADPSLFRTLHETKLSSNKNRISTTDSCKLHNSFFEENLSVKGLYNRLFFFDSFHWHAAHNFFGDGDQASRLTYVVFFESFCSQNQAPMQRLTLNNNQKNF